MSTATFFNKRENDMRDKQYFFFINQRGGRVPFKQILVWSYCISLYGLNRTTNRTKIARTLHLNRQTLNAILAKLVETGLLNGNTLAPQEPSQQQAAWFYRIRDNGLPWYKQFGYFKLLLPADDRISMAEAAVWAKIRNLDGHRMSLSILARELGLARATVVRSLATLRRIGLVTAERKAIYDPSYWLDAVKSDPMNARKPGVVDTILSWYPAQPFGSYYHDDTADDRDVFAKRIRRVTRQLKEFGYGGNLRRKFWRHLWDKLADPKLFEMYLIHASAVINMAAVKHRERHGGNPAYSFVRKISETALYDLRSAPDPYNWEPVLERIIYGEGCSI
jgi:DNA-binding MarR family transcriptional regulator